MDIEGLFQDVRQGTVLFLGLLCFLAFVANAALLAWLLIRKGGTEVARCPRCGRTIVCPHCADDNSTSTT